MAYSMTREEQSRQIGDLVIEYGEAKRILGFAELNLHYEGESVEGRDRYDVASREVTELADRLRALAPWLF